MDRPKFLSLDQFEFAKKKGKNVALGKGSFATVHLVICKKSKQKYAMKIVGLTRSR